MRYHDKLKHPRKNIKNPDKLVLVEKLITHRPNIVYYKTMRWEYSTFYPTNELKDKDY